jgi:hypothetical protein
MPYNPTEASTTIQVSTPIELPWLTIALIAGLGGIIAIAGIILYQEFGRGR